MIPLKISLKNFLSYGPHTQIIDFKPHHLICLSGKNGHGKSALLDAMSWALWGQARKITGIAKPDSHLLHLGQTHMKVVFDIAVKDSTYRIKREYSKTYGKSGSTLEVSIFDALSQTFKPLTTNALRTTQQRLEELIGLTYDAFINTAFLRQGSSNEFSKKSPKDRKEILSTILGLNHYEVVRKTTYEKIKYIEIQLHTAHSKHDGLQLLLQELPNVTLQLQIINNDLKTHQQEYQQQQEAYLLLYSQEKELFEELTVLHHVINQMHSVAKAHIHKKEEIIRLTKEWRITLANARQGLQENQSTYAQRLELFQQKSVDYQKLTDHINTITITLMQIKQSFEQNAQQMQQQHMIALHKSDTQLKFTQKLIIDVNNKILTLEQDCARYCENINAFNNHYNLYDPNESNQHEKKFEKYKYYFHQWTARANALSNHYKVCQEILSDSSADQSCPMCHQNLTQQQASIVIRKNNDDKIVLKRRIDRLAKILDALKKLLIEQHNVLKNSRIIIEQYKQRSLEIQHYKCLLENDSTQLTAVKHEYKQLLNTQQQLNDEHASTVQQMALENGDISQSSIAYKELEDKLVSYQQQRDNLKYDHAAHHTLLEHSEQHLDELQKKAEYINVIQKTHSTQRMFIKNIIDWKAEKRVHSHLAAQEKCLQQKNDALAVCKEEIISIQSILAHKQTIKGELLEQKGKVVQHYDQLINNQHELDVINITLTTLNEEKKDLEAIYTALGKDGIQALFIEEVIPCIEQEANRLLAQLTDNQSQLFIESLRDLKNGGTKETLDIKIADAQGIRSYELFSGGEAFRIDFALRIAISRLIAARTGGSLQTLIIDEGFGSQDEEGLSHIMDVLYRIQSSFAKIIIVSHLSSMKEQFPVHFVVNKESQGSVVRTLQQG